VSDLEEFAKQIENRLVEAVHEPHWTPEEAQQYMATVAVRHKCFARIASHLNEQIVGPRLETLARHFPNAKLSTVEPTGEHVCWLGYCERFPASTKVTFTVEHDVRFEKVSVGYAASMVPVFVKFNEHDRLMLPLERVDDETVAQWLERRLLEFLDSYLRIDRGGDDFAEDTTVDPVCGMRISRSLAAVSTQYRGHAYYFCSADCESKFSHDPTAYVRVKTT